MKYTVHYKICGKEHKTKVAANSKVAAESKVFASLQIISCEPEEAEIVTELKELFGMK